MKFRACCVCVLVLSTASPAISATGPVLFEGTIAAACTLSVTQNGALDVSTDLQTLSSHVGSGTPGSVTLVTTGGVQVSVDPVTVVTPPPGDSPTTWLPTYLTSGATNFAEGAAANTISGPGQSTVTVHLAGTKSGPDRFAAGYYSATVTVRCE